MNLSRFLKLVLFPISLFSLLNTLYSQQLAFPTAEGYGKYATGGRGGKVYEVTTLNASGSGSLGAALGASGKRTVVFKVSGTIKGNFGIKGDVTVAGQTAPGDGICIAGNVTIGGNNVILRYFRVRPNGTGDALGGRGISNVILDHISCSWSNDEVLSIYQAKDLTIQHCLISEACQRQNAHRFGGIWGAVNGTYHHNTFAHSDNRLPRWAGKQNELNDFRNNIIYNPGYGGCRGALGGDKINMIANYIKPGPATKNKGQICEPLGGNWFVSDNVVVGNEGVTKDNWKGLVTKNYKKMNEPWPAMPINQETAEEAYNTFLKHGGCSFPNRDAIDKRIIEEMRTGTAKFGKNGIIDSPADVGGLPELKSTAAPADGDHDGMPDAWEKARGLDPSDAKDGNKIGEGGYTNLEIYLNSLVSSGPVGIGSPFKGVLTNGLEIALNNQRQIDVSFPTKSKINLRLYDMTGKMVATLIDDVKEAGTHSVDMTGVNLRSGLYVCKLSTSYSSLVKKMFIAM